MCCTGRLTGLSSTPIVLRRVAAFVQHQGTASMRFPLPSTSEGGLGAYVREVPTVEQHIQGGVMQQFYTRFGVGQGDPFRVVVSGLEKVLKEMS